MNRILFGIVALGLLFAVGQALQCYKCELGLWGACLTTNVTCGVGEQCFSGVGTAAKIIKLSMKGCLPVSSCNQTTNVTWAFDSAVYQMTKTCCATDMCNAAPRGAYGTFLSLALATVTGAMITGALV